MRSWPRCNSFRRRDGRSDAIFLVGKYIGIGSDTSLVHSARYSPHRPAILTLSHLSIAVSAFVASTRRQGADALDRAETPAHAIHHRLRLDCLPPLHRRAENRYEGRSAASTQAARRCVAQVVAQRRCVRRQLGGSTPEAARLRSRSLGPSSTGPGGWAR